MTAKAKNQRTVRPSKQAPKTARAKPKHTSNPPAAGTSKLDRMIAALRAPQGSSITDLMALTGWQVHSVRGAIAGALKKKRGLAILSAKVDGERIYRIARR